MDRIDRKILAELARNARLSMTALSAKVGLSKTPVQNRVRQMENTGLIRGYRADIDREKLGEGHIAFVQVTLSDTRSAALDAFNKAVFEIPEIGRTGILTAARFTDLDIRRDGNGQGRLTSNRNPSMPKMSDAARSM